MNIRLSQSQPCGFLKRRRADTPTLAATSTSALDTLTAPPLPPPATPPSDALPDLMPPTSEEPFRSLRSRVDAYTASASRRRPLPKLPFEICITINRYLAPDSAPGLLHRVAEGGPVTYVFLGRADARSFLARLSPADVVSTVTAPLTYSSYAPQTNVVECVVDAQQPATTPRSALLLKDEWLDMILCGRKTWEIRSMQTHKRERVALAQSGTPLLFGDVEIIGCVRIDDVIFRASTKKHGVPLHRHAEIIGKYKNIFAWELARPRRYKTPLQYMRSKGQQIFVDLRDQQAVFANVRLVQESNPETVTQTSTDVTETSVGNAVQVTEPARSETSVRTRLQAAAAAAEARAAAVSARGIGDATRARAMQQASQSSSTQKGDAPFGAARSWKLREALQRSRASAKASILPPPASASSAGSASVGLPPPRLLDITPLGNYGNTCFLNAIIQCLRTVCNRLGVVVPGDGGCPLSQLLAVPDGGQDAFRKVVLAHPLWRELAFGEQHDAHEAIRLLLDGEHAMHSGCASQSCFARTLTQLFAVDFQSFLACTEANCSWHTHPPADPGTDVSMAIRPGLLQTLLSDFEMPEHLTAEDDYACQQCAGLVQKTLHVQPLGRALLLHLKRFEYNQAGRKRNDVVTFPRTLAFGSARYEFAALVEHRGKTLGGGHYVAYVESSRLFCCNDAVIAEIAWQEVEKRQAYLLAYIRTDA